jgi:hypothetical protein
VSGTICGTKQRGQGCIPLSGKRNSQRRALGDLESALRVTTLVESLHRCFSRGAWAWTPTAAANLARVPAQEHSSKNPEHRYRSLVRLIRVLRITCTKYLRRPAGSCTFVQSWRVPPHPHRDKRHPPCHPLAPRSGDTAMRFCGPRDVERYGARMQVAGRGGHGRPGNSLWGGRAAFR